MFEGETVKSFKQPFFLESLLFLLLVSE
jgi:hypothetical protein